MIASTNKTFTNDDGTFTQVTVHLVTLQRGLVCKAQYTVNAQHSNDGCMWSNVDESTASSGQIQEVKLKLWEMIKPQEDTVTFL